MNKYKASEIISRDYDLADIKNTDFLTHEENTHYINDAWKQVYQWLINKGDKQFVKEVQLSGASFNDYTEYELPEDLYQILSIKSKSGYIVNRKSESESYSSATYEVFNDKLRLYGCASDLIMTYWTVPIWITYPDRELPFELDADRTIVSHNQNCVLLDNGAIINVVTGETIATVDADIAANGQLGNGLIYEKYDHGSLARVWNFNGNLVTTLPSYSFGVKDYNDNILYQYDSKLKYVGSDKVIRTIDDYEKILMLLLKDVDVYIVRNDDEVNSLFIGDTKVDELGMMYEDAVFRLVGDFTPLGENTFSFRDKVYTYDPTTNEVFEYNIESNYPIRLANLKYGNLVTNFSDFKVVSAAEDTEFNFPNEIYIQLLACDLAIRYCMKMNADFTGLNNLYQTMQTTFMNTLSQDANYSRIINVYRS